MQVVVGVIALGLSLAAVLVGFGRLAEQVRENKAEIDRLRLWRHSQVEVLPALANCQERITRLESKVFNGYKRD